MSWGEGAATPSATLEYTNSQLEVDGTDLFLDDGIVLERLAHTITSDTLNLTAPFVRLTTTDSVKVILPATDGRLIYVVWAATATIQDRTGNSGNIECAGNSDLTGQGGDVCTFINNGGIWYQATPISDN